MFKLIKEASYSEFFPPEVADALSKKSTESRKKLLGNKQLIQVMMQSQRFLNEITAIEKDYIPELEALAVQIVQESYPIVEDQDIKIIAKIGGVDINMGGGEQEENLIPIQKTSLPEDEKRRIINGITQGAAVRGAYAVHLFKEYLDAIDETLLQKYNDLLNLTFGIYDDDEAIAMLLAMLAQQQSAKGGEAEGGFDEESGELVVKATGANFAFLVHEIIKGLYEIVSLQGFTTDKEKNKQIVQNVDKLEHEPDDLRYGKFIYDGISKLYNESNINDPRVREYLFVEIYKLEGEEFKSFIENIIKDQVTPAQKLWVKNTLEDIKRDLVKDDTGLEDLDELQITNNTVLSEEDLEDIDDIFDTFGEGDSGFELLEPMDESRPYDDVDEDDEEFIKIKRLVKKFKNRTILTDDFLDASPNPNRPKGSFLTKIEFSSNPETITVYSPYLDVDGGTSVGWFDKTGKYVADIKHYDEDGNPIKDEDEDEE